MAAFLGNLRNVVIAGFVLAILLIGLYVGVQGFDPGTVAASIEHGISREQRQAWTRGTPADWANEAHAIARDQIYPPLQNAREIRLPRDYAWRESPVARVQLARAGVRLAFLLNTVLR